MLIAKIFYLGIFTIVGVPLTVFVRPTAVRNYLEHPALFALPAAVIMTLFLAWKWNRTGRELPAFLASSAYIVSALAGVGIALYPALLPSSYGSRFDITIFNAAAGSYALRISFIWWGFGMTLATGYFIFLYWMFKGKVQQESAEYTEQVLSS